MRNPLREPRCPQCGARVRRRAALCVNWGHALALARASDLCPTCGGRLSSAATVCPICGASRRSCPSPWPDRVRSLSGTFLVLAALGGIGLWIHPHIKLAMAPTPTLTSRPTLTTSPTIAPSQTATTTPTPTPTPSATPTHSATTTPSPAPTSGISRYTVVEGDTLSDIALRFDLELEDLLTFNSLTGDAVIQVGQELAIPRQSGGLLLTTTPTPRPTHSSFVHIVEEGDNLSTIAVRYDVAMAVIAEANNMEIDGILRIGRELVIPGITLTPTPKPTPSPTATVTRVPSPTPVLIPTPSFPYQQPHLLAPTDGATIRGTDVPALLNWTSVGILAENEWYELRLYVSEDSPEPITIWTKAPSWRVPRSLRPAESRLHRLAWQVVVVERTETLSGPAVSPPSEKRTFYWE
jgi:LysM repeat protein